MKTEKGMEVFVDGLELEIGPSLKLRYLSPTGFSWGNFGLGAAQLAVAILYDLTEDRYLSSYLYDDFKQEFLALSSMNGFSFDQAIIEKWINQKIKGERTSETKQRIA
jgi:hypothetical protein